MFTPSNKSEDFLLSLIENTNLLVSETDEKRAGEIRIRDNKTDKTIFPLSIH